jgi:hypothetical protein
VCDEHRDATGDAGSQPSHLTKSTHA